MAGGNGKGAALSLSVKPNVSLSDLSDDLLLQILFFLPSINDLKSCFQCSKRLNDLVHHSPISERLFASLFQHSFGGDHGGSKRHWKARYGLQQCAVRASRDPNKSPSFTTMSVLTPKQERQAFIYDNGSSNSNLSIGYFGMKELWEEGPLCVWGDFCGIRLFPSLNSLMRKGRNMKEDQAVTVAANEPIILNVTAHGNGTFFLACASGNVYAVRATMQHELKGTYTYDVFEKATAHTNEVTSLSVLTCPPRLISASCDGTVCMYPDSITKSSLTGAEQIIRTDEPILYTLAAGADAIWTSLSSGTSFLWKHNTIHGWIKRQVFQIHSHTPTQILLYPGFMGAIIGDNGDTIHSVTTHDSQQATKFRVHRPAETLSRFGDVVIVGGGIVDGGVSVILPTHQVKKQHCLVLGEQHVLRCHPGKKLQGALAYSSVVSALVSLTRQSLITLSRDGTIAEWRFAISAGFVVAIKRKQQSNMSRCKRPRPLESTSMLCVVDSLSHLMTYGDANIVARTKRKQVPVTKQPPNTTKIWECEHCKATNTPFRKRNCVECGKQGETIMYAPAEAAASNSHKKKTKKLATVERWKQPPNTIKMWECQHCGHRNKFRKFHCERCTSQGGNIVYIPNEHLKEEEGHDTFMDLTSEQPFSQNYEESILVSVTCSENKGTALDDL